MSGAPRRVSKLAITAEARELERLRLTAGYGIREWSALLDMSPTTYEAVLRAGADQALIMIALARLAKGDAMATRLLFDELRLRLRKFARSF